MTSLAIGPVNSAGQASAWAAAVREHTGVDAASFGHARPPLRAGSGYAFSTDVTWPHPRLTPRWWKSRLVDRLLRGRTHLAVDSFASLYDRLDRADLSGELDRLRRGFPHLALSLVAHGSDIRDPERHAARLPQSYYASAPTSWSAALGRVAARNRDTARASGLPLFVSTPDLLLEDVPATWLPVCVDPAAWACPTPAFSGGGPPVVLHLPSRREPPIKGSDVIDLVLRRLHEQGRVRYLRPAALPPAEVRTAVHASDIVVDQVASGYYGVAAVEGMAAGRLVIGSLADDVAAVMPQRPPLIDVPHGNLDRIMDEVLADLARAAALAAAGPAFVARFHDGRESACVLAEWLGVPLG